jgi:hypothetical protein
MAGGGVPDAKTKRRIFSIHTGEWSCVGLFFWLAICV